ncbi:hypothetical protein CPC16_000951 [Podila verticillata]|nr:hypothetical protein CPC16_000951 [Podila verticillata]
MVLTRSKSAKHDDIDPDSITNTAPAVKRKAYSPMATPPEAKISKTDIAPDLTTFKAPPKGMPDRLEPSPLTAPTVPPPTPSTTPAISTTAGSENSFVNLMPSSIADPTEIDLLLSLVPPPSTTTTTAMPHGTQDPVLEVVKEPTPVDVPLPDVSNVLANLPEGGDVPSLPLFPQSSLVIEPSAPPAMMATTASTTGTETAAPVVTAPTTASTMPGDPQASLTLPPAPVNLPPAPVNPVPVPPLASMPPMSGAPTVEDTFVGSSLRDHPLQLLPTSEGDVTLAPTPPPLAGMEALRSSDFVRAAATAPNAKSELSGLGGLEAQKKHEKDEGAKGQGQPESEPNSTRDKKFRFGASMIA